MPNPRFRRVLLLLAVLICLLSSAALAGDAEAPFAAVVPLPGAGEAEIPLLHMESGDVLFLPSAARPEALVLRFSGETALLSGERGSLPVESGVPFSLLPLLGDDADCCPLTFIRGEEEIPFLLMRSSALGSAYLISGDPEHGRSYVEADKDRKVKGVSFALLRPDGSAVWTGELKNIKGRGNSTWDYPKKPYQIKLGEKADLLETGDPGERESTWVLLANYVDESLLRNRLTFDLAADLGLPYTPHSLSVDLFYDGEYRGVYLLCEKTEVSGGRVAIHDLEGDIGDANPGTEDPAELPGGEGSLPGGLIYRCVPGLAAPEDLRGGYLLELDYELRAREEASWFCTESGQYVTVKSPEFLPEAGMRYIADLYQRFERAVFAGGTDPVTGQDYRELCDLDSLARCFLLLELSKDNDAFRSSSYFYKPSEEERLYAGPVWDFDTGYGVAELPEGVSVTGYTLLGNRLLHIPSFREALRACWGELKPLVTEILLSDDPAAAGDRLRSLAAYDGETAAARRMDRVLWGREGEDGSLAFLRGFLLRRTVWLEEALSAWSAGEVSSWTYTDVGPERWFHDEVEYVTAMGLFTGSSALRFQPYRNLTRNMAVTVLHRMLGSPAPGAPGGFRDAEDSAWYGEAVAWAREAGITGGVGENLFAPDFSVTREDFVTLIYRCLLYAGVSPEEGRGDLSAFPDGDRVSPWAGEAMAWAVGTGVLRGIEGSLEPQGDTDRAQAAVILARVYRAYLDPAGGLS